MIIVCIIISIVSNPSAEDSLRTILDTISTLTAEWFNLGVALGLSSGTLTQIKSNHSKDPLGCVTETVNPWLHANQFKSILAGISFCIEVTIIGWSWHSHYDYCRTPYIVYCSYAHLIILYFDRCMHYVFALRVGQCVVNKQLLRNTLVVKCSNI